MDDIITCTRSRVESAVYNCKCARVRSPTMVTTVMILCYKLIARDMRSTISDKWVGDRVTVRGVWIWWVIRSQQWPRETSSAAAAASSSSEQSEYVRYGTVRGRECRRSVVVGRLSGKSSSGRRRSADRALRGDCERHAYNDITFMI